MTISGVLGEAFEVYRRLWRRSVVVAGLIFAVVALAQAFAMRHSTSTTVLVSLLLGLVGGLLVQGALVEIVRDMHEGRQPVDVPTYYNRTRDRLGTLLGSSILYGLGVGIGFILAIIPGLIAIARWSLIVPLVMIERQGWRDAFRRSSELVRGRTGRVLALVVVANVITAISEGVIREVFAFLPGIAGNWVGGTIAGAVAVPFSAHVLTVLYYRLTEPERPILPEATTSPSWTSIWDEPE